MSESRNKRLHVVINGQNGFDERVKNDLRKYYNIWKTVTGYLLDYDYFDKYYKMIVIDLSKHQVLNANPKAIRKINFTRNLCREDGATISLLLKKQKKPCQIFYKELWKYCKCVPQFIFI